MVLATLVGSVVLVDLRIGGGRWELKHDEEEDAQDGDEAMDQEGEQVERRAKKT